MPLLRPVAAVLLTAGLVTACGGDADEDPAPDAAPTSETTEDETATPEPTEEPAEEPTEEPTAEPVVEEALAPDLTAFTVTTLCEEFVDLATELRGEAPQEVVVKGALAREVNGVEYAGAGCDLTYPGHDIAEDPNSVTVYVYQTEFALTDDVIDLLYVEDGMVPLEGIGEQAGYTRTVDGEFVDAEAAALLGDRILSVYTTVPDSLSDEPFLEQEPMVAALEAALAFGG